MKRAKHHLIERLTTRAMEEGLFNTRGNGEKYKPLRERDLPGRLIMSLPRDDREVLKECTGKDFKWRGHK